jgi:CubicO group peptidase (beta-lactamase class C family)
MQKIIILASIITQLLASSTFAQNENLLAHRSIDSLCKSYMDEYRISALSVGIVKEGKEYYSNGYGFTSFDSTFSVSKETQYYVASITKLFTGCAIMKLVEEGMVQLGFKKG